VTSKPRCISSPYVHENNRLREDTGIIEQTSIDFLDSGYQRYQIGDPSSLGPSRPSPGCRKEAALLKGIPVSVWLPLMGQRL
jgi:hypothetical protein